MILVRSVIKGDWRDSDQQNQYALVNDWAEAINAAEAAKTIARVRTESLRSTGGSGRYLALTVSHEDFLWKDLTLDMLPGISLPMLKRVLDYVPAYEQEAV